MSAEEADCSSALISIKLFIEAMDIECNIQKIKSELPSGVKLVAVSKFHPVEALREAYDAGKAVRRKCVTRCSRCLGMCNGILSDIFRRTN